MAPHPQFSFKKGEKPTGKRLLLRILTFISVIILIVTFFMFLITPSNAMTYYDPSIQEGKAITLTSHDISGSFPVKKFTTLTMIVYPLMNTGTKTYWPDDSDDSKEIPYNRPYEYAYVKYQVYIDDKLYSSEYIHGFTQSRNEYKIPVYATGKILLKISGRYTKVILNTKAV